MYWLSRRKKLENRITAVDKGGSNAAGGSSIRWNLLGFLSLLVIAAFAACSASDKKNEAENAQAAQQATAGAVSSIGGTSKSLLGSVGRAAGNSSATNTVLAALGLPPNTDPDPTNNLEEQLGEAIASLLKNGESDGDTVTFDPDETEICNDPLLSQVELLVGDFDGTSQNCIAFYSHIRVQITPGGDPEEGTLVIKYNDLVLATIQYSSGSVSVQLDLAQLNSIASAMEAEGILADLGLPETMEGVVRTTLTELGPDHGQFVFSIIQEVNIVDSAQNYDITIAEAAEVFQFTADGPGGTITADLGLGALAAMFPVDDATGDNSFPTNLNLSAATLHAELTAESLVITNFGIGGAPFTLDSTANPGVDFSFAFDTFGVTLDETGLTFDQPYNSTFEIADGLSLFSTGLTGIVGVSVPQGSAWTVVGSVFDNFFGGNVPLIKVGSSSGSTTTNATGAFAPSLTFNADECFTLRPSFGFPLQPAGCP